MSKKNWLTQLPSDLYMNAVTHTALCAEEDWIPPFAAHLWVQANGLLLTLCYIDIMYRDNAVAFLGQLLRNQRLATGTGCKDTHQGERKCSEHSLCSVFHQHDTPPQSFSKLTHRPVGRSTSWSSFLTNPMLFGVEAAKERKLVKLVHSIPLESKQILVLYLFFIWNVYLKNKVFLRSHLINNVIKIYSYPFRLCYCILWHMWNLFKLKFYLQV